MAKQPKINLITHKQSEELVQLLRDFSDWLIGKGFIRVKPEGIKAIQLPASNEDWVMRYDEVHKTVSFNTIVLSQCSHDYFKSVMLHEFFHLAVQRVPNKEDAVKIKDDFGNELMNLIDIEADFFTALYFKEMLNFTLVQYLKLYYEGRKMFKDKWIRIGKLERYIGTLIGISKMFMNYEEEENDGNISHDLYLPSISPLYTEESMHVLVVTKENIYFDLIHASQADFLSIKKCYTDIDTMTFKSYATEIIRFVAKALNVPIPEPVQTEINKIEN